MFDRRVIFFNGGASQNLEVIPFVLFLYIVSIQMILHKTFLNLTFPLFCFIIISFFILVFERNIVHAAAAAKSLQSCPTLCNPIDSSPLGSPVPGILQARTLEWVAISFSNAWKWNVKVKSLSSVWLLATPWTAAHQAPPSMGFSRQEYWSGVPSPSLNISLNWSVSDVKLELCFA